MNIIAVIKIRKSYAARPRGEGRHAVSKIGRAVGITKTEDSQRNNIATM